MKKRGSGVLLHISSLPSPFGIGDFGLWAYRFADWLADTGQSYWQVLPLNITDPIFGNSPYCSISAFAGNPMLISPELLVREGLLCERDLEPVPHWPLAEVDFPRAIQYKKKLLHLAYEHFKRKKNKYGYRKFCAENSWWLDDSCLFAALKERYEGAVWSEWPDEIRDREPEALKKIKKQLQDRIGIEKFFQFIFTRQWLLLKKYCNSKGIDIIGDIPIYGDYDSADLWVDPGLYKLDKDKKPYVVAGVPPDYFSRTGQLWGNPVYDWDALRKDGFSWWVKRLEHNLALFDYMRIDHFRGLVAYWEVPAGEKTAINGKWVQAPAIEFLNRLIKANPSLPLIAEDLGHITPDVSEVMALFDLPGMKVLLFAFGGDLATNPYIPHNIVKESIVYTGTHDNNTVRGWFENEATAEDKARLFSYLGREAPVEELHWEMIRLAMMSVGNVVIVPLQDILGLGQEGRMNRPATGEGNWKWRMRPDSLAPRLTEKLKRMTETYGRI